MSGWSKATCTLWKTKRPVAGGFRYQCELSPYQPADSRPGHRLSLQRPTPALASYLAHNGFPARASGCGPGCGRGMRFRGAVRRMVSLWPEIRSDQIRSSHIRPAACCTVNDGKWRWQGAPCTCPVHSTALRPSRDVLSYSYGASLKWCKPTKVQIPPPTPPGFQRQLSDVGRLPHASSHAGIAAAPVSRPAA